MRTFLSAFLLSFAVTASAATLNIDVDRHGFKGSIDVAIAPRVDGRPPEWSQTKTLAPGKSSLRFENLGEGLYVVLLRGPHPLQRLSAKANLGANDSTLRLDIPKIKTTLRATLAGEPIARAAITLTHDELRWQTDVQTNEEGRYEGDLWEPGLYTASVTRDPTAAPHRADIALSEIGTIIDVPDRHVRGRILTADGTPLGGATITLRSETSRSTLTVRTHSAPDGRFEFFGVREGTQTLIARATSYLDSDAVRFELHGPSAQHEVDMQLTRGEPRVVRVVDARGNASSGATLITSCNGDVKSTAITNAEGRAEVALPRGGACAIYTLPKEGSIAVGRIEDANPLLIRVPEGTSSLRLVLKTEAGDVFSDLRLLMRIDGTIIPPEIARLLGGRGFSLITNAEGSISLQHIPPGTYEFWPYRTPAEGQMMYDVASDFAAPISVRVLTGENNATIRFQAR